MAELTLGQIPGPHDILAIIQASIAQQTQVATDENAYRLRNYRNLANTWRLNRDWNLAHNIPRPVPPLAQRFVPEPQNSEGGYGYFVNGPDFVCPPEPDDPPPPPAKLTVELGPAVGSTDPVWKNCFYKSPTDNSPDGFVYQPFGPAGPAFTKRVMVNGPFSFAWYVMSFPG